MSMNQENLKYKTSIFHIVGRLLSNVRTLSSLPGKALRRVNFT